MRLMMASMFRQPEQAGLGVARLRTWRYGAHFEKAEAKAAEPVDGGPVLVKSGCQPNTVGEA
jgi:hypothetical protein